MSKIIFFNDEGKEIGTVETTNAEMSQFADNFRRTITESIKILDTSKGSKMTASICGTMITDGGRKREKMLRITGIHSGNEVSLGTFIFRLLTVITRELPPDDAKMLICGICDLALGRLSGTKAAAAKKIVQGK